MFRFSLGVVLSLTRLCAPVQCHHRGNQLAIDNRQLPFRARVGNDGGDRDFEPGPAVVGTAKNGMFCRLTLK